MRGGGALCDSGAMELRDLGYDEWFASHAREQCGDLAVGRVTAVDRGRHLLRDASGEVAAELTGRLRFAATATDLPCVGDWVCVRPRDGGTRASIHAVLPRRSFLRRKVPGRDIDHQMIAANVDVAFLVQSCHVDFNVRRLERYLVMVREGRVEPVLLLTKADVVSEGELAELVAAIRRAGITERVIAVSNVTGTGLDAVRALLAPGRTYCLLGSSGVGKSTLINRLTGRPTLETQEVSHTGEGRHTTMRRQMLLLDGGALLVDTPGMRELGMLGVGAGLDDAFADVAALATGCRFADCTHRSEPGCAVRAAVDRRELDDGRLRSYLKLEKESSFHEMSYVERRQKDREFGRHVRAVKKHGTR